MKIGVTLKKLRKGANLTQKALADKCNISRGYLADLEADRYNPSIDTLKTIADALGVSVNDFFDEETKKEKTDTSIKKDLSVIPKEFTNSDEAREYVNKHQIFGSNGFDSDKLDDNEILDFANELLKQMELISFKFKK
ncbi:helix-turn-helix domain-containing protein [Clostridium niameyense]|uniref:helix-turn-helix domain-containing protein n=1 Tax=Clostridium niameyense TaxID=1622073 RepID=UPI0009E31375|nr:helix-turn-helix transcriptional regulator [Clostridium niameyense]